MRKFIVILSVCIIALTMSVPVKAATLSVTRAVPGLSINGTTATCSLKVYAEQSTDSITASVTLKHGNTIVKQWSNMTRK